MKKACNNDMDHNDFSHYITTYYIRNHIKAKKNVFVLSKKKMFTRVLN